MSDFPEYTYPADIHAAETWRGYGTENGTLEKVYLEGNSPDDVRGKALARPYSVNLHVIWRVAGPDEQERMAAE